MPEMHSVIRTKMWNPARWSSGLLCILVQTGAVAQQQYEVTGTVLDAKTMAPVPGAVILLAGTLYGALTESDGYFEFADLPPGQLTLVVSADKYAGVQKIVTIQKDQHLRILLVPLTDELPDQHTFPGPNGYVPDQLFRSILPQRQNAGAVDYSLYGSPLRSGFIYLNNTRILDLSSPLLASADLSASEVIPGPYRPDLGLDAVIHYKTDEQLSTGTTLMYDSRRQRIIPTIRLHHMWSHTYAAIHGNYDRANHYTNGSGVPQNAGIRSVNLDGRVGLKIAQEHKLSGHGGWMQETEFIGQALYHQAALIAYNHSSSDGLLRRITASVSHQKMEGGVDQEMQNGFVVAHLAPLPNLRMKIGGDYYRLGNHLQRENAEDQGLFMALLHQNRPVFIELQLRLDPFTDQWGGTSLLTWQVDPDWQLIAGIGRAQSDERQPVLRQIDLGVRWTGLEQSFELMTFARETAGNQILGIRTYARGTWWKAVLYTATSQSRVLSWGRIHAMAAGPFNLFTLGSELYGMKHGFPAWISMNLWVQSREFQGVSLRIGINNLLDGTYTYPSSRFSEPGRSFLFSLSYRHNSSSQ